MTDQRACLVAVHINPELRVKVARGPAQAALIAGEWRSFLIEVRNEAGTTAALRATSVHRESWLELDMVDDVPSAGALSGAPVEYRTMRVRSTEVGRREASLAFDVGQGTQDIGYRNEVPVLFDCRSPWSG